jgi:hypothetical protein
MAVCMLKSLEVMLSGGLLPRDFTMLLLTDHPHGDRFFASRTHAYSINALSSRDARPNVFEKPERAP